MIPPEHVEYLKSFFQVQVLYVNWRGEEAVRTITPLWEWHGSTDYHPEPQRLVKVWDYERNAERDYATKDILLWGQYGDPELYPVDALLYTLHKLNRKYR